ncbi:hypothetical protein CF319_g7741 [Tilletia indica]|nr:hypothetical protein CF319_g7741 [Tilletia indica]
MSFLRTALASAPRVASLSATSASSSSSSSRLASTSVRALSTISPRVGVQQSPRLASSSTRPTIPSSSSSSSLQISIRNLSTETRSKLDDITKSAPLVLFMKGNPDMPMCGFSRAVVQILDVQGVNLKKMKTVNVLEDEEVRHGVKEYSDWPTIPQVYVGGEFVGGCDIMLNMHQSGELEELLVKNGLITDSNPQSTETPAQS